jgi:hypothetical protein
LAVAAAANDDNDYDEIEKVTKYGLVRQYVMVYHDVPKVKKVKCTVVQAMRLCTGHMAHRGSRGIALL